MALYNRLSGILGQASRNSGLSLQAPQMLNAFRSMSSKLFIGGLDYATDETSLRDVFSSYGEIVEAKVITDRDTGRSRGFGFVSYSTDEAATSALNALDGKPLQGRSIRVSYAQEKPPRSFGGGGGSFGGGGGGYRGGYGDSNDGY